MILFARKSGLEVEKIAVTLVIQKVVEVKEEVKVDNTTEVQVEVKVDMTTEVQEEVQVKETTEAKAEEKVQSIEVQADQEGEVQVKTTYFS